MTPWDGSVVDRVAEEARQALQAKFEARERGLTLSREAVRNSANAIRAVHRNEWERAAELLAAAREAIRAAQRALAPHPDVLFAGFVHDAEKEVVEAAATYALLHGDALPLPADLGAQWNAYLHGIGEACGELRRYLLDLLRQGRVDSCEPILRMMDDIYSALVTIDFPDGMTAGLRRTTDMVRGVLEKTRGDLTVAVRQQQLEAHLARVQQALRPEA